MIKPYSPNLTQRVQTYSGIAAEAIPLRNIDIVIYSAFSTLDHSLDRGLQTVVEGYKGLTQSIKDYICYSKRGRMREKQQRAKELEQKRISIPVRRSSKFKVIKHTPEGYLEGGWKTESTRLNQIRFYNQILENKSNLTSDGLTTLKFKTISKTNQEKYTFISVEL